MQRSKLLKVGIVGAVVSAVCCFTPVLVVLLGVIGFSSIVVYLDYVLLPVLALFIFLILYALWMTKQSS